MSHELSVRENGMVEMCFTGSRNAIWHGLGQELEVGASIIEWKKQAGMDWEVFESLVKYQTSAGEHIFPDRKVLFRSDTKAPLAVVSNDYKIVQPGDVLDFFEDLVTRHGMQLSTAGCLFGGKRFWALAETGKSAEVIDGDEVKGNLLLTTAVDGTMATCAKFVTTRVVCNNTLTMAMSENSSCMVRKTHRSTFDADSIKLELGLIDESWTKFIKDAKTLAATKMDVSGATNFFQNLIFNPSVDAANQSRAATKKVNELLALFTKGTGADMSKGSAWGALNAVTESYTHGSGKRNPSHQFWDSYVGADNAVKTRAMDMLLAA